MNALKLTILHSLPNRVRIYLSHPPANWKKMKEAIASHSGIEELTYSPITRTVLLRFNPGEISFEEFLIRQAVAISWDYQMTPVIISKQTEKNHLSIPAYSSAALIALAFISKFVPSLSSYQKGLSILASLGTVGAVVDHGYREYRERGNFDPEVLSVIYLGTSFLRGTGITASLITWLASFGRHLSENRPSNLMITPVQIPSSSKTKPAFEVTVNEHEENRGLSAIFRMIPSMLVEAASGGAIGKNRLIDQIRQVSSDHDRILEGFGDYKKGISLRID